MCLIAFGVYLGISVLKLSVCVCDIYFELLVYIEANN